MRKTLPTRTKDPKPTKVGPAPKPGNEAVLILPDIHFPDPDWEALEIVKQVAELVKPVEIVQLGDMNDAGPFSTHPRKSHLEEQAYSFYEGEIKPAQEFFDALESHTNRITYLLGNHEARLEKISAQFAFMEAVFDLLDPTTLMSRRADGSYRTNFKSVPYSAHITDASYRICPDLIAIHGITHAKHAAAVTLEKIRSLSCIHGHTHRQQSVTSRDPFNGRIIKAWCPGTLSQLKPFWQHSSPPNGWVLGFDVLYRKVSNPTEWTNYTITVNDGEAILPDGRTVRA